MQKNKFASARLYSSISDCLRKSQGSNREFMKMYKGYSAAILT